MADFSIQNVENSLLIFDYQNIGNSIKPPTATGTAVSVLGFDEEGNAISATIGDATETTKGVIQLAGDLQGTADAPKIKQPEPGSMTSVLGFDAEGALVTGSTSGVADATTTTTGVIQLAGDLEGTATAPKIKKPADGTATSYVGFDETGNLVSSSSLAPDATTTTKGIVQLAGDLEGTAESPKIKQPEPGTAITFMGFDSSNTLVVDVVPDATNTTKGIVQLAGDLEGTASQPKLKKPSSGTATSFIGFDATNNLVSSGVPDATTTTKGIVQLAGDLAGTAESPKLKKPSSGTAITFMGFDETNTLVVDMVPDATTTTKGIVQLAGDLEGTAESPKLKKPSSGTATSFLGFDDSGALVSDTTSIPDATDTTKGILKLAGDLHGTADAPTIKQPAPGTIVSIAGFDSEHKFVQSEISKAKHKTQFLRRYAVSAGSLQSNTTVYILNSATQQTTYNSVYALDTTTSTFVTTGNIKHIKELLLDPYLQMRWITVRIVVAKNVADFPNTVVLVASLNRVSDLSPVAQTSIITSSFMSTLTMEITTFVLGSTDPFVTGGYFLTLHHNDGVAMSYGSVTITAFASDDKIN